MTKRGVAYLRVSTEEQAHDDKFGLESQRQQIEAYCQNNDITINPEDWFIDAGISGKSRNRPEFNRILSTEVQNPPIECVVVAKADRISRDVTTYYVYKDLLARKNIEIVSVKEDWGSQDKITATILEGFMAIMADVERETITMRTAGGRRVKAKNGGYSGGNAPYGYAIADGEYTINEAEAGVVRYVFKKHREGLSNNAIARGLNADARFKPRTGARFYSAGVGTILANQRTYLGFYRYGKDGEWVKGRHEPIITEDDIRPKKTKK